ncbi:MAG: hypothetical protein C1943_01720 [Halochromatium sp.]|nr:hypothetical protein [Halochromatium sp.]
MHQLPAAVEQHQRVQSRLAERLAHARVAEVPAQLRTSICYELLRVLGRILRAAEVFQLDQIGI